MPTLLGKRDNTKLPPERKQIAAILATPAHSRGWRKARSRLAAAAIIRLSLRQPVQIETERATNCDLLQCLPAPKSRRESDDSTTLAGVERVWQWTTTAT